MNESFGFLEYGDEYALDFSLYHIEGSRCPSKRDVTEFASSENFQFIANAKNRIFRKKFNAQTYTLYCQIHRCQIHRCQIHCCQILP